MRGLGTTIVLIALVALQVPFFTCQSDCQSACLPLWVLDAHRCHEDDAHHHRACLGHEPTCGCTGHDPVSAHDLGDDVSGRGAPEEGTGDGDAPERDGPGDHDLVFHQGVRASAPTHVLPSPSAAPTLFVEAALLAQDRPSTFGEGTSPPVESGPPGRRDTVRLLL